jgi:hypothetical protein
MDLTKEKGEEMTLTNPVQISSSLQPCIRIGGAEVCIEYSNRPGRDGRVRYRWQINMPDGTEYSDDDIQSGCQGGSLQEGMESLLSFLGAAAESYPDGENADLFPLEVVEWAAQHSDEISMAQLEVEENKDCIIE